MSKNGESDPREVLVEIMGLLHKTTWTCTRTKWLLDRGSTQGPGNKGGAHDILGPPLQTHNKPGRPKKARGQRGGRAKTPGEVAQSSDAADQERRVRRCDTIFVITLTHCSMWTHFICGQILPSILGTLCLFLATGRGLIRWYTKCTFLILLNKKQNHICSFF